jgi:hypothetical protein
MSILILLFNIIFTQYSDSALCLYQCNINFLAHFYDSWGFIAINVGIEHYWTWKITSSHNNPAVIEKENPHGG